jgi:hypothetical protein
MPGAKITEGVDRESPEVQKTRAKVDKVKRASLGEKSREDSECGSTLHYLKGTQAS